VQLQRTCGHSAAPASSAAVGTDIEQVVRDAARGDQRAWDQLVARYNGVLWAVARAHRLETVDAADVVQTTWLRLVEHLGSIKTPGAVGAWLATTARRESLRAIRRTARCQPSDQMEALSPADPEELDAGLLGAERDASLWHAFHRLPARDQTLLRLLTADPAPSYEEISAALAMPVGSIGPTRARALERLRRELGTAESLERVA
jgi:RNA polymerase sigma factor (sigma-70 family)